MQPDDAGPSVGIELGEAGNTTPLPAAGDVQIELHPSRDEAIPKVREHLRRVVGNDLFAPYTVSIGPYHKDTESWLCIREKNRAVNDLERCGVDLSSLKQVLERVQSTARRYYTHLPDNPYMESEKFCRMLLYDGCYLLSIFVQYEQPTSSTMILKNIVAPVPPGDTFVLRDILYLLENQIPLFIMDEILKNIVAPGEEATAIACIWGGVEMLLQKQLYISQTPREAPSMSSHLLDLVYHSFAGSEQYSHRHRQQQQGPTSTYRCRVGRWRRAIEYRRYADILFQPRTFDHGEEWTILGVRLYRGRLSIPVLHVNSNTFTLLRNLMVLEERMEARPVTAYCVFMSLVARTAEDVDLLQSAGVIVHFLESNESIARGFADLCYGVVLDLDNLQMNYLKPIWHDMEKRCGMPAHNFMNWKDRISKYWLHWTSSTNLRNNNMSSIETSQIATSGSKSSLQLQYLKDITNNFCDEQILGKGGFGVVYKGLLDNGEMVAVKKLIQAIPTSYEQFENEVNLLMELKHQNIVRLVGYCYETQHIRMRHKGKYVFAMSTESLLCLEYLPNGSLDKYISDASSGFNWHTRWKVIEGISYGVQYLHYHYNEPIIHLDLKPGNILLDANMLPKIADFGISRMFDQNQTIRTANTKGSFGYMPPEFQRGIITPMWDIFSLGVIIMEVITGHRDYPYDIRRYCKGYIEKELQRWRDRLQKETGYTTLETDCQQIERCIQIGLICVNPERSKRPTMKTIVNLLQGTESMDWYISNELSEP